MVPRKPHVPWRKNHPDIYFYADQYKNENNWKAHYHGTGMEILNEVPGITHFVTGLGTTGSFIGTSQKVKKKEKQVRSLFRCSPTILCMDWRAGNIWKLPLCLEYMTPDLADENIEISTEEAYQMIRDVKEKEGLILSPSSAANLVGAIRVASEVDSGIVVTLLPDNGDKYGELNKKLFP